MSVASAIIASPLPFQLSLHCSLTIFSTFRALDSMTNESSILLKVVFYRHFLLIALVFYVEGLHLTFRVRTINVWRMFVTMISINFCETKFL